MGISFFCFARSTKYARSFGIVASALVLFSPLPAQALQPLRAFVASARVRNPDNRRAAAVQVQREAQGDVATGAYLPTLNIQGQYTHNEYAATLALPGAAPITVQANDVLDAYFTLSVPVINVGVWRQKGAAKANFEAANAARASTEASVEESVAQAYYQLLGAEALVLAADASLRASESNQKTVTDRREIGVANELDLQRVIAEVASAQENVASAAEGLTRARRNLESVARLSPEPATPADFTEDDLHEEGPLAAWMHAGIEDELVAVRAAILDTKSARESREVARAAWIPTVGAEAQEHLSSVAGFTGKKDGYSLLATATWKVDFTVGPNLAAQDAALDAAAAAEDKTRRAAADDIYQSWNQVRIDIEKVRAARAQVTAATLAQRIAQDRYAEGVATQLEVVQAERDLFSATVSEVQANADLQYARTFLRLASRRTGDDPRSP